MILRKAMMAAARWLRAKKVGSNRTNTQHRVPSARIASTNLCADEQTASGKLTRIGHVNSVISSSE